MEIKTLIVFKQKAEDTRQGKMSSFSITTQKIKCLKGNV
jgi:hypothetical protein